MGFRDLRTFNEALLATQCWRLIKPNNSIVYNVLKATYFKRTSVLDATRGWCPSFSWKSLWGCKSLLLEGIKWRVGNGRKIRVWDDAWLPGPSSSLVLTAHPNSNMDMHVSELICGVPLVWNEDLFTSTFDSDDADRIRKIYISHCEPKDELYSWPNKHGSFTTWSAYLLVWANWCHEFVDCS
ncbi:hypothetical protein RND81_04G110900 [Saponaria officinalis]|uniref:Reverse transcriptase n=1 Tax=Saponaria officinalis TaxID=3572 RepID=A0AAW1LDW3_SAPOF